MEHFDRTELKPHEIWLGNTHRGEDYLKGDMSTLKTLRLGKQAFDIHGKKLHSPTYLPIFINKSEEPKYDEIYMNRMKNY